MGQKVNADPTPLSLRADLIRRRVLMGKQPYWVLKDPLSREFFYFDDREYAILQLLDGQRSLADVASRCADVFAPDYLSTAALVEFLADARRKGLIVAPDAPPTQPPQKSRRAWWQSPLAIRLPGINPDRLLARMEPSCRFLFTPAAAAITTLMAASAIVIVVTRWDTFADHVMAASARSGSQWMLILLLVLAATKIVHELAHGLACTRFGGHCREIGVMLLVGVPCLYCDVSDAWMLRQRWKRVAISLAGIGAELVVASIATFVWLFTADGTLRDICVSVMTVCSIATILFNGNPLLRYDGYFVLSDWVGIPNLANESSGVIGRWVRSLLWRVERSPAARPLSTRRRLFLFGYGIASGLYRVLIVGIILAMMYRFAQTYELDTAAGLAVGAVIAAILARWVRPILTPPTSLAGRHTWTFRPAAWVSLAVVAAALLLPIPHRVIAPMSVRPAGGVPLFVSLPGRLSEMAKPGLAVHAGDVVVRLTNASLERERNIDRSEMEVLNAELTSLRRRRVADRLSGTRIPVVSELLHATERRIALKEVQAERLTLRAPRDGTIFSPPQTSPDSRDERRHVLTWAGTPLTASNRGAWFNEGTEICLVGDAREREALVMVRQQDIPLIRVDQRATLLLPDRRRRVAGRVIEVAASPIEQVPGELTASGMIEDGMNGDGPSNTAGTYYQVRVVLEDAGVPIPVRTIGRVRIDVGSASIVNRLSRWFSESFR